MPTDGVAAYARIGFSLDRGRPLRPRGEGLYSVSYTHSLTHTLSAHHGMSHCHFVFIHFHSIFAEGHFSVTRTKRANFDTNRKQYFLYPLLHYGIIAFSSSPSVDRDRPTDRPTEQETDFD